MQIYKREIYLNKIRGFYHDASIIKVITGIRRCGKSCLLDSIILELKEAGVKEKDIIEINLDKKDFIDIETKEELSTIISERIKDNDFKYLFLDEIQKIKDFEKLIEAYRIDGNMSIFITGSNSYLLSGELATKLTGRKVEFEILPLNFYEYLNMKKFLKKEVNENIYLEFEEYIRYGGFPGSLNYETLEERNRYTKNVLEDIFNKDVKPNEKIKDVELFSNIERFVINNFGALISASSICKYYESKKRNIDIRTVARYLEILENAKIIIPCEIFDLKSKQVLTKEKKYYLADLAIYFAFNTDNRINYGPVLENILHNYLISKDYNLSVGKIGKLECDFIARKNLENYYYLQVSMNVQDDITFKREVEPFYQIKSMYPRYLFTLNLAFQKNIDGIHNLNIVDFIANNEELI